MLSPDQFGTYYHGSNTQFEPGDELLPPEQTKNTYWGRLHHEDMSRVYSVGTKEISATEPQRQIQQEDLTGMMDDPPHLQAEKFAWNFATQRVSQEPHQRGAVYEVAPHRPQQPLRDDVPGEVFSESAKVLKRIDIAPGRQGTFPQINWNQFAEHLGKKDTSVMYAAEDEYAPEVTKDYNHPADQLYIPPEFRMHLKPEEREDRMRRRAQGDSAQERLF